MYTRTALLCLGIILGSSLSASSQTFVPPNIDFESGTATNWTCYRGAVATGFIYALATSVPVNGLHTITSGTGTDMYGGFPVVGLGSYSMKIAHDTFSTNADAVSYNVAVPSSGTYTLIYQYAAVLQDPSHMPTHQPVFEVQAIDSSSGTVFFDSIIYDPTPGFILSTVAPNPYYKAWTNVSVDLSAYAGKTVTMKFYAAACSDGGHWGYAYIDIGAMFETYTMLPLHAPTVTMTGPAGYASYKWTDAATFTASYGTTAGITITAPAVKTKYALILTPVTGHGTVDTVYETVDVPSTLSANNLKINSGFSIYPNPSSGMVNIQWADQQTGIAQLQVTDMMGKIVKQATLKFDAAYGRQQIDLGTEVNGIYYVTIKSDAVNYTGKIIIQK